MKIKNSRGPSTEPCKMPLSTALKEENKLTSFACVAAICTAAGKNSFHGRA